MHPGLDPTKVVTAAIFYNLHEADVALGLLESCGVDCFLCDEHMHRVHPLTTEITGGVRLQVSEQDLELAKELLKEYKPMDDPFRPRPDRITTDDQEHYDNSACWRRQRIQGA